MSAWATGKGIALPIAALLEAEGDGRVGGVRPAFPLLTLLRQLYLEEWTRIFTWRSFLVFHELFEASLDDVEEGTRSVMIDGATFS